MTLGKRFADPSCTFGAIDTIPRFKSTDHPNFNEPSTFPTLRARAVMKPPNHHSKAQGTSVEETHLARDLTTNPISAEDPTPSSSREAGKNPVRTGNLAMAKKTFQSIDAISGVIPIVGTYAGVVAKVGLAVIHVVETMEGNKDIAQDLEAGISKLSRIAEEFDPRSDKQPDDEVTAQIQELTKEIERLQKQLQKRESSARLAKATLATDQKEALNESTNTVYNALVQLQALDSLNITGFIKQLRNDKSRARL